MVRLYIPHVTGAAALYQSENPGASPSDVRNALRSHGILGDKEPLNKYYAYGIRNIFGIGFDPVTGKLWDTENGPDFGDEINLVEPGFNSGWRMVQGIWTIAEGEKKAGLASENPDNLVDFNGKGKYSTPEFTCQNMGIHFFYRSNLT